MYVLGNEAHGIDYENTEDRFAVRNHATGEWLSERSIFEGGGYCFEKTSHLATTFSKDKAYRMAERFVRGEFRLIHELDLSGYI